MFDINAAHRCADSVSCASALLGLSATVVAAAKTQELPPADGLSFSNRQDPKAQEKPLVVALARKSWMCRKS